MKKIAYLAVTVLALLSAVSSASAAGTGAQNDAPGIEKAMPLWIK